MSWCGKMGFDILFVVKMCYDELFLGAQFIYNPYIRLHQRMLYGVQKGE